MKETEYQEQINAEAEYDMHMQQEEHKNRISNVLKRYAHDYRDMAMGEENLEKMLRNFLTEIDEA